MTRDKSTKKYLEVMFRRKDVTDLGKGPRRLIPTEEEEYRVECVREESPTHVDCRSLGPGEDHHSVGDRSPRQEKGIVHSDGCEHDHTYRGRMVNPKVLRLRLYLNTQITPLFVGYSLFSSLDLTRPPW